MTQFIIYNLQFWINLVFLFAVGLCVGSFLNVVVDRLSQGKSIFWGRSHCDFCKRALVWYDLFPIFSYIFLRRKCRYCKKHLSLQYPLMELVTGLLFVLLFLIEYPSNAMQYAVYTLDLSLVSVGLILVMIDFTYRILPDILLFLLFLFGLFRIFLTTPNNIPVFFVTACLSTLPLLLLFLFSKGRAMGFGDVKLIFVLGFLLGFPKILICYYVAFLTGAIAGVILILGKKKKLHGATIAFGPFLLLGSAVAALFGESIWLYVKIFLGF